jgi:hypothetical protein
VLGLDRPLQWWLPLRRPLGWRCLLLGTAFSIKRDVFN